MMSRKVLQGLRWLPALVVLACGTRLDAAPPTPEEIFPANTTEFVAVSDLAHLENTWRVTNLFRLMNDPALKPFLDDINPMVKSSNYLVDTIGIGWKTVRDACSGELGWGLIWLKNNTQPVAHVLTLDLSDRGQQADALQKQMIAALQAKGGNLTPVEMNGIAVLVCKFSHGEIVYGIKDGVLVVSDHIPTFQGILARWDKRATNSLANHEPYRKVRERTQPKPGEKSGARWYFDVIERFEVQMILDPNLRKVKGDNFVEVLKKLGMDAVRGAGGQITLSHGGVDIIARVAVYAPKPHSSSLRMAKFINETPAVPPAWVPDDVHSSVTFNVDVVNAFDSFDTLFERLVDEKPGTFKELMQEVAKDPLGPQVDLRSDIFGQLRNEITLINDAVLPVSAKSERILFGMPTHGAKATQTVAEALKKCFENDKYFKKSVIAGHVVWQYHEKQKAAPPKAGNNGPQPRVFVPSIVFSAANDNLYIGTHIDLLEKVLRNQNPNRLSEAQDYRHAMQQLANHVVEDRNGFCSRSFIRVGENARNTYEMLRMGKLAEAESIYAWGLTKVLKADEMGRKLWINGGQLPEYAAIKRYLGNVAIISIQHDDGWSGTGIVTK